MSPSGLHCSEFSVERVIDLSRSSGFALGINTKLLPPALSTSLPFFFFIQLSFGPAQFLLCVRSAHSMVFPSVQPLSNFERPGPLKQSLLFSWQLPRYTLSVGQFCLPKSWAISQVNETFLFQEESRVRDLLSSLQVTKNTGHNGC